MGLISKKVTTDFLKRKLDNWDWLKKESKRDVTDTLKSLEPVPKFGKVKLWLHQKVAFLLMVHLKRFLLFLDMGGGKTLLTLMVIRYLKKSGQKVRAVVFVPYVITVDTWVEETEKWTNLKCVPLTGTGAENLQAIKDNDDADLFVICYQSAVAMCAKKTGKGTGKNPEKGWSLDAATVKKIFKGFNFLAMDEIHKCFVKGTKVLTPKGHIPIEALKVGDKVISSSGVERVTDTFRHTTNEIVTLVFDNGKVLKCTPDHPFLTNGGWLRANRIVEGMYAYDYEALSMVPKNIPSQRGQQATSTAKVLWDKLLGKVAHVAARYTGSGVHGRVAFQGERGAQGVASDFLREGTSQAKQRPHEAEQPRQGLPQHAKSDGDKTSQRDVVDREAWGQRDRLDGGAGVHRSLLTRLATRVSGVVRQAGARLSNLLQGGRGEPGLEDSHRMRRSFSPDSNEEAARLKARYKAGRTRVVSISVKKYRRPVPVFNVEVSNTPHYFAEGILTHNCKNVSSMTYRMCRAISKQATWSFGLTGTPFGRNLEDLWAQFYLIDLGETLGNTLGLFKSVFFAQVTNYWGGFDYKFKKKLLPTLKEVIKHRSIRYTIDEIQDMPKRVHAIKHVTASAEIAKYYNKQVEAMENLSFGKVKYRQLESEYMKLRQLSSGFMTLRGDDSSKSKAEIKFPVNPKLDALEELIGSMPEESKMIVFHDFRFTNKIISDRLTELKIPHARVWGGAKNSLAELRRFKKDKRCRILVINCQAGSSSQNLQMANYVVYFEQPRSAIDRQQADRRAWRPGQKKRVFFFDLLMKGTPDEKQYLSNEQGRDLLKEVLDGRQKFKKLLV